MENQVTLAGEQGEYVEGTIQAARGGVFNIPNEPGLYALYQEGELIWISGANDLRVDLQGIILLGAGGSDLRQATHFCIEEVPSFNSLQDKRALFARGQALIEQYQKDHDGKAPRCNEILC